MDHGKTYKIHGTKISFTQGSEADVDDELVEKLKLLDETVPLYGQDGEKTVERPRFSQVRSAPAARNAPKTPPATPPTDAK
jgi:hypothetical protein